MSKLIGLRTAAIIGAVIAGTGLSISLGSLCSLQDGSIEYRVGT